MADDPRSSGRGASFDHEVVSRQALQGSLDEVAEFAKQRRQFTYIDDVVPTIAAAPLVVPKDVPVLNIGSDEVVTVQDVIAAVAAAAGIAAPAPPGRTSTDGNRAYVQHMQARFGARTGGCAAHDLSAVGRGMRLGVHR